MLFVSVLFYFTFIFSFIRLLCRSGHGRCVNSRSLPINRCPTSSTTNLTVVLGIDMDKHGCQEIKIIRKTTEIKTRDSTQNILQGPPSSFSRTWGNLVLLRLCNKAFISHLLLSPLSTLTGRHVEDVETRQPNQRHTSCAAGWR